ncbi:MAG: hypothetical protein LBH28_07840 [Oscillospiraceae bacterium]|jgi:CobQ-like glutamine amidotransferase family enzyme|nr:hypothetical protein [Oscillospiraceae bacterium]
MCVKIFISKKRNDAARMLHLYHDLMNLYGDWANVAVLARELAKRGAGALIDYLSVGDGIDFGKYDFVFIGSGTERNQRACMGDLARHADAFISRIEEGMHVLATGNSHELFGHAITAAGGERYGTLGLLDFETMQRDSRVTGDCVLKATFLRDRLIGFINRAGHGQEGGIERPFLAELGPGANDLSRTEGIRYKNLLGTYITGPVLVRNPPLLDHIADMLCPDFRGENAGNDPFFGYQAAAYHITLGELSARIKRQ